MLPGINSLAFVDRRRAAGQLVRNAAQGHAQLLPATTWLEAIVWVAYVVPIMTIFILKSASAPRCRWHHQPLEPDDPRSAPATVSLTALGLAALVALTGCVTERDIRAGSTELTVDSSADACTRVGGRGSERHHLVRRDQLRRPGDRVLPAGRRRSAHRRRGRHRSRHLNTLVVQASAGDYFTVCKPGMVGAGVGKALRCRLQEPSAR